MRIRYESSVADKFEIALVDDEALEPATIDEQTGEVAEHAHRSTKAQRDALSAYLRSRAKYAKQKQVRIDTICDLMARGEWNAQSCRELATKWGCRTDAMKLYASHASAVNRRLMAEDRDTTRAIGIQSLEALKLRCEQSDDPKDRANEVKVLDLLARIHGWEAPKQVEMSHKVVTREEALAELRDAARHDPSIIDALGEPIPED
jgi:hypothetical protein